jgi:hypothetical protein
VRYVELYIQVPVLSAGWRWRPGVARAMLAGLAHAGKGTVMAGTQEAVALLGIGAMGHGMAGQC